SLPACIRSSSLPLRGSWTCRILPSVLRLTRLILTTLQSRLGSSPSLRPTALRSWRSSMGIKKLPTRTDDSLGRIKEDKKPAVDKTTQLSASEYNALADAVVEIAETIGLEDGSTPGSIEARLAALEAGGGGGGSGWTAGIYTIEYAGDPDVWRLVLRDHIGELPLPEELLPEEGGPGVIGCQGLVSVPSDTP